MDAPLLDFIGLLFFLGQELVDDSSQNATCKGSYDEDPNVLQSLAACENSGTDATSGVDGGAGEGNTQNVYQSQGQTDDQTGDRTVLGLGGDTQDGNDEYEGQDDFDQDGQADVALIQSVGTEAALCTEDGQENGGTCDSAGSLCNDVADEVLEAQLAADQHGDGNCGVDVATGNVTDGVCHGHDDQTEGQSGEQVATTGGCITADSNCGAAGEKHQYEGTDKFRDVLFDRTHKYFSFQSPTFSFVV